MSNTVWRLTEEDFMCVISDRFPELTKEESDRIIEHAKRSFSIYDWDQAVRSFIETDLPANK